jgi:hypothetical protein
MLYTYPCFFFLEQVQVIPSGFSSVCLMLGLVSECSVVNLVDALVEAKEKKSMDDAEAWNPPLR